MDAINRGPDGFPQSAPCALLTHYRTYARLKDSGVKETWEEVNQRTVDGLAAIGNLTLEERAEILALQGKLHITLAGRVLWVGGTPWSNKPGNEIGLYNCSSLTPTNWSYFNLLMRQLGMGTGVGFVLFPDNVNKLPRIKKRYDLEVIGEPGEWQTHEHTSLHFEDQSAIIEVGDSLEGWANAFELLLHLYSDTLTEKVLEQNCQCVELPDHITKIKVITKRVRKAGSPIKGFGGVTNPKYLREFFTRVACILNQATGRNLLPTEVGHIQCICAALIVAGNIRRCLPGDTQVIAYDPDVQKEYLKDLCKLTPKELVKTPYGYREVWAIECDGVKKVAEIKTQGFSFKATAEHRVGVLVDNQYTWKQVSELQPGDMLIHLPSEDDSLYQITDVTIDVDEVEVWDVEVGKHQCFYFQPPNLTPEVISAKPGGREWVGVLSHNSALMIQYLFSDLLGAIWKDDLWVQGEDGKWKIDPFRDPLRMANVTRVAKKRSELSLQDITDAVTKQYYSGEGAIQYAGSTLLRTNRDVINTPALQEAFIQAYEGDKGLEFLMGLGIPQQEALDRLDRLGLNPCVTGDTWVHTTDGPRQVKEVIGVQHDTFVNGEPYNTTPKGFFSRGVKPIVKVITKEGYTLKLTPNHQLLKVRHTNNAQYIRLGDLTKTKEVTQWVEAKDLEIGDLIKIHKHIPIATWPSEGSQYNNEEEGYAVGSFVGDKVITPEIEKGDYEFYLGFLRGVFDSEGWVDEREVCVKLAGSSAFLEAIQRMLLRLAIKCTQNGHELVIQDSSLYWYSDQIGFTRSEKLAKLLANLELKEDEYNVTVSSIQECREEEVYDCSVIGANCFDANGFLAHNCGEIPGHNFMCNLGQVHLELLDPKDYDQQDRAFRASALGVAALLNQQFQDPLLQTSRDLDPIVGVTFTGLFDFFVHAFGPDWLKWWDAGREDDWGPYVNADGTPTHGIHWDTQVRQGEWFRTQEKGYLNRWRDMVTQTVSEYCQRHNLKVPNRCTSLQPSGTKSLLTGGCSAFYAPKAPYYWRNITVGRYTPEAQACVEFGYQVLSAQSCKDPEGRIIEDPFDPRVNEWLIHIPCRVPWADIIPEGLKVGTLEGAPIESQWDLYETVDTEYVTHTTSVTLEFSKDDIPTLSQLIYKGVLANTYVSAALLNREYTCFPNMPFCPMTKGEYHQEIHRLTKASRGKDLEALIQGYQLKLNALQEAPPPSCGGDACEVPGVKQ